MDLFSAIPLAIIFTLSSSSKLLERLRYVSVSVHSRALARLTQSESFIPKSECS